MELTGLDETPKDINVLIRILERGKVRTMSKLHCYDALLGKVSDIT